MDARSLKYIAEACRGELRQGLADDTVSRVSTDSRQVQPGDLFIPLKGDRFDAHDFISDVAAKGATAILIENAKMPIVLPKCGVIAVESTRQALGQLAARYRRDFDLPVVAIGGSNGKTSSKEILATVLRQKFATLASEASFNNDVGTPLSLMRLDRTHGAAVLEVGTNHPGELAPLVRMVQPRIGVITSIGREHLEFFGSVDGVAEEEGQLAELLPPDGVFFTNGDSEWAGRLAQRTRARVVKAGLKEGNDWRARDLRMDDRGMNFVVETPRADLSGEYRVSLLGRHQVVNAILGTAVGAELGLDREQLQRALAECAPAKMRLQLFEAGGVRVLNDAYNANADSMRAALDTLRELSCEGRRIAVLGDMGELGEHSASAHEEVGRHAVECGVNHLFAVGKHAAVVVKAARAAGLKEVQAIVEVDTAAKTVKEFVRAGDLVLVKASRAMRLERVADALKDELEHEEISVSTMQRK